MSKYIYIICQRADRSYQPYHLEGCMECAIERGEYCGEPYEYAAAFSSYKKAVEWLADDLKSWKECANNGHWADCETMMKECSGGTERNRIMAKAVVIYRANRDYCCREITIVQKPVE